MQSYDVLYYYLYIVVHFNDFLTCLNWIFVSQPRPLRTKVVRAPSPGPLRNPMKTSLDPRLAAGSSQNNQKIGGAANAIFNSKGSFEDL